MRRILSLFTMLMLCGVLAFAQDRVVSGTVTDDKGAPVEGASIKIKGTKKGTSADVNGNYRISVPAGATLVITGVGITPKEAVVGSESVVNVVVNKTSGIELAAVVVGAQGIRSSARSAGYSKGVVTQAQLVNGHPTNVAQALSGKVSGLSINNNSSSVNASPRIVIRGLRSITGNNTALVVLDGVAVPSSTINTINANDVERIDVLKGGQAATLFGSDGVNGAIVITTKKGSGRKPEISLINTVNTEDLAYLPKFQTGFGSGSAYGSNNEENFHPAENQQYGPAYDGSIKPLGRQLQDGSILLLPYSNIADVRKKIWDKGYTRQTDVSYRAGSEGSSFYFSYQNLNSNGIVPGDKYERNVLRMNSGRTYNKVTIGFDAAYSFDNARRTNTDFYFFALNAASWAPLDQFKDWQNNKFADPKNYYNDYYNNPFWEKDNNRFNTRNNTFNANVKLDYKLNSDLTFTGRVALTQGNTTQTTTSNNYSYSAFSKTGAFVNYFNNDYDRYLTGLGRFVSRSAPIVGGNGEFQSNSSRITADAFGVHNKNLGNFTLKTVAGLQAVVVRAKSIAVSTNGIGVSGLYNFANSASGLFSASNGESQTRKIGAYGDVTLGFKDILFLHGSARRDYTSVFSNEALGYTNPAFTTYGGDISLIASDLIPSIKNRESKVFDQIKLRAEYNVNGNDNLGAYSLQTAFPNATGYPYSGLLGTTIGNTAYNPVITPEKVKSVNLGAEIGMFKGRLLLEGSVYRQISEAQILNVSVSAASGFTNYLLNAANVENKGYELDAKLIAYRNRDLTVNISANYSYITNTVKELFGATGLNNFEYQAPDDRASLNAAVGQTFPYLKTTAFQRDAQGRVVVDPTDGWPLRADARVGQGTTLPKHNLGVGFSVKYKNLSLVANAEYRGGALVYHDLGTDMAFTGSGAITSVYNRQQFIWPNSVYLDAAGKSVPNTSFAVDNYKAIYQGFGDAGFSRGLAGIGEVFVSSADFWKLRDVSLNYDFSQDLFRGNVLKGASISFWGRNLVTFLSKDNWYTDPELSNTGGNSQGINTTLNTPPTRQIGGTLKLIF
jgi:TonB-linked SusC/RagA family outer membrane protein